MENQSTLKKFAVSLSVFMAALAVTYGVSTYLERRKTPPKDQLQKSAGQGNLVYYKSVGQVVDAPEANTALKAKYTVEILATTNRVEAEKLVNKLKDDGVDAFYTPLQNDTHVVYRVRQGIFAGQGQAKLAVKKLQDNGFSGKVIQLD